MDLYENMHEHGTHKHMGPLIFMFINVKIGKPVTILT